MINAFVSRGLPPPQQQQMLSLRATNQPSLLNANPMLQRALLMQQMQGTVVMGDTLWSYLIILHGLKPYFGCFLLNHCSPCIWQFRLSSPLPASNLTIVHITEVLQLLKIPCAQLFTTRNSTRKYHIRY